MSIEEFKETLKESQPDSGWSVQLQALWFDGKDDWEKAHDLIDHLGDPASARVHAYLHRVEGDLWNARYWYGRANAPEFTGTLEEEWSSLLQRFMD